MWVGSLQTQDCNRSSQESTGSFESRTRSSAESPLNPLIFWRSQGSCNRDHGPLTVTILPCPALWGCTRAHVFRILRGQWRKVVTGLSFLRGVSASSGPELTDHRQQLSTLRTKLAFRQCLSTPSYKRLLERQQPLYPEFKDPALRSCSDY